MDKLSQMMELAKYAPPEKLDRAIKLLSKRHRRKEKMETVGICMTKRLKRKLDHIAKNNQKTHSEQLRVMIDEFLEKKGYNDPSFATDSSR